MNRPALILAIVGFSLLSTKYIPHRHIPPAGWRLSDNIVYVGEDNWSAAQIDEEMQDIIIADALRDYYMKHAIDFDLDNGKFCYLVNDDGEAITVDCPIEAP